MKKLTCTRIWWFQTIKENVRHSQHAVTQTTGMKETKLALEPSKEEKKHSEQLSELKRKFHLDKTWLPPTKVTPSMRLAGKGMAIFPTFM